MASTPPTGKIVKAAKATSKHFMVGHICRFNPRYVAAKAAIAEGRIGKINRCMRGEHSALVGRLCCRRLARSSATVSTTRT